MIIFVNVVLNLVLSVVPWDFPGIAAPFSSLTVHWIPLPMTILRVLSLVYSPIVLFICPCCPYRGVFAHYSRGVFYTYN